ncbi:MAG: hypothetical protein WCT46_00050 [Candidatus Gracilibacteria bacterium]
MIAPLGAFMVYLPNIDDTASTAVSILVRILGVFFFLVGICMFYVVRKSDRILNSIYGSPETLVWIFKQDVVYKSGARTNNSNIMFNFSDGKTVPLNLSANLADEVLVYLMGKLPKTRFGYSEDIQLRYKQNPGSLIKSG